MNFKEKVFEAVARIPKGRVATYGQVASMAGFPGASRAVGNAIHMNTDPVAVPCHRVVCADGRLGSNYGLGGPAKQRERLEAEGIEFAVSDAGSRMSGSRTPDGCMSGGCMSGSRTPDGCMSGGCTSGDGTTTDGRRPATGGAAAQFRVDLSRYGITIEDHPLKPFLPAAGHILFLGSFPPPKSRWSMDFFYPNWINDFWRIQGLIHFDDAHYFESGKHFNRDLIAEFCTAEGLGFFDTAQKVFRMKGNASDDSLQILQPSDLCALLAEMPECRTIVTTGGKASEELLAIIRSLQRETAAAAAGLVVAAAAGLAFAAAASQAAAAVAVSIPAVGASVEISLSGRTFRWWRMPSTSRAFPMSLEEKARYYRKLFM